MTEQEINKAIEYFKKDHTKWVERKMLDEGEVGPMIVILATKDDQDGVGVIYSPITGNFGEEEKEDVVKRVIPKLFETIKGEGMSPLCFSFCSEVFVRKLSIEGLSEEEIAEASKNVYSLPKTEALLITFESKDFTSTHLFDMERIGKVVNKEGEMIDQIKLTESDVKSDNMTGRFANIFKKYI